MKIIEVFYRKRDEESLSKYRLSVYVAMLDNPTLIEHIIKRELGTDVQIVGTVYPKA